MVPFDRIQNAIESYKHRYKIKKAILFGSYASGKATEQSDIDLIVEFQEDAVSLFDISGLKHDLEESLGIKVDVIHGPLQAGDMIKAQEVITLYEQ